MERHFENLVVDSELTKQAEAEQKKIQKKMDMQITLKENWDNQVKIGSEAKNTIITI